MVFVVKLDQLKVLQAVVEVGSVKGAAEKLHKTQPAISLAVKALESQTGAEIFDRTGYRLELTPIGKRVYMQSLRVTAEAADLNELVRHFERGNEEQIIIAKDDLFDVSLLTPCLQDIQQEFPDTRVILRGEILSGTTEVVEKRIADIGVAPLPVILMEEKELEYFPIAEIEMVNVAAPDLLSTNSTLKDIKDFRSLHQILISDSGKPSGEFDRDLGVQKGQRVWYVSDIHSKKSLLVSGLGWGRLPRHLVEQELAQGLLNEVILDFTRDSFIATVYVFRSSSVSLGPVASALWNKLHRMSEKG
jgi:DNA-binding transcriptional LysR family regulator